MSQDSTLSPTPEIGPPGPLSLSHRRESGPLTALRDRHSPIPEPSIGPARERDPVEPMLLRMETEDRNRPMVTEAPDLEVAVGSNMETVGGWEEVERPGFEAIEGPRLEAIEVSLEAEETLRPAEVIRKRKRKEERIAELESEIREMRGFYEGVVERKTQDIRAMERRLKLTEGLLSTRSAELSGTHTFLSTTDRLSEVEVLGIVRDLNENIYQVAVNLTEGWEKLESPQATRRMDVDPASQSRVPALVQLVRNRDPMGLTFLLQSRLCSQVAKMSSSWGHHQESAILESIYQRLSASEGQAVSANWRSLTHSHLSRPPLDSALLVEQLADVLDTTGSFLSTQQSLDLVRVVALKEIESIIELSLRLEFVFKVEVKSSDMTLLFEAPGTVFDGARMANEFGSDGTHTSGRRELIAGTTEVGVRKNIRGGADGSRREGILLKTKVVLEKDVVGDGKQR